MRTEFRFSAIVLRLCVALLAFLGMGCDKDGGDDNILLMYGCPTGKWEVKGKVTDEAGAAVPAATVKVTLPELDSSKYAISSVRIKDGGDYTLSGENTGGTLKVVCIPDNPELKADSTVVSLTYKGADKNNPWDFGKADATVNFKLKKSNQQ